MQNISDLTKVKNKDYKGRISSPKMEIVTKLSPFQTWLNSGKNDTYKLRSSKE